MSAPKKSEFPGAAEQLVRQISPMLPALAKLSNPPEDVSQETRNLEFDVKGAIQG